MTKNILRWNIDNGRAREIEEYLKESDAQGRISRLAFTQYSAASFDSWNKDAEFSADCPLISPESFLLASG